MIGCVRIVCLRSPSNLSQLPPPHPQFSLARRLMKTDEIASARWGIHSKRNEKELQATFDREKQLVVGELKARHLPSLPLPSSSNDMRMPMFGV